MLIWALIIVSLLVFIPFYISLGKEWYGPYSIFYLPMLACYVIAALNADKWNFVLSFETFIVLLLGEISFFVGCFIAKKISLFPKGRKKSRFFIVNGESNSITTSRLALIVLAEFCFFALYLIMVYFWGIRHGKDIFGAINSIMLNGKFDGDGDPLGLPFLLQICLQMNYIAGYLFAFLLARRVLLKDKSNLFLLISGYVISILTNFLGGSRGPILEIFTGLLISFGITYYFKTKKKFLSVSQILKIVVLTILVGVCFFEILPLMGRSQTAANESDVFTQYIGSQIYNLNYYIETVGDHSTFFCAETLKSLYADIESFFGITLGYKDGMVGNFFVFTPQGHNLGNVFTTYFNFYIDLGLFGVCFFTAFIGWFSEKYFKSIRFNSMVNIDVVFYIYMASSIAFRFFASRFFKNVIQLKMFIKIFWMLVILV